MVDGFSGAICRPAPEPARLTKTFDYYFRAIGHYARRTPRPMKFAGRGKPGGENQLETRFTRERQRSRLFFLSALLAALGRHSRHRPGFVSPGTGDAGLGRWVLLAAIFCNLISLSRTYLAPPRNFFPRVGLPTSKRRCLFRRLTSSFHRREFTWWNNAPETSLHSRREMTSRGTTRGPADARHSSTLHFIAMTN